MHMVGARARTSGGPDEQGNIPAARLVVQLDNRDGRWSTWQADGAPAYTGAGQLVHLWAHNASGDWWLFSGRIARYDQRADDTVELEAFDVASDLAQPVGTYTPGAAGDFPGARLTAIVAAMPTGVVAVPTRFDGGVNRLTAQPTEQAPLEEMQTVAASDGGLVYVDADGTVVSVGRAWRAGRTDQVTVPVVSDNVCTVPVVVWDPVIFELDANLAETVRLENVAGLKATAQRSRRRSAGTSSRSPISNGQPKPRGTQPRPRAVRTVTHPARAHRSNGVSVRLESG